MYGDTNIMSDAISRGYDDVVAALRRRLGIELRRLELPAAAYEILNILRVANLERIYKRPLTENESKTSAAYSTEADNNDNTAANTPLILQQKLQLRDSEHMHNATAKKLPAQYKALFGSPSAEPDGFPVAGHQEGVPVTALSYSHPSSRKECTILRVCVFIPQGYSGFSAGCRDER